MIRAHKIRLNPTTEQEIYLKKACGVARFTFNWGLARWREEKAVGNGEYGPARLKAEFNAIKRQEFPWVMEVTKNAVEDGFRRLGNALNNYFSRKDGQRQGEAVGFPNFKSKKRSKLSFTLDYERFRVDGHWLHLQKLKSPINIAEPLRFEGRVKWATISCVAEKWYVSICVEVEKQSLKPPKEAVGVDLGIKTLATLSDGVAFENQKLLRSELVHYRRLCRQLSRRDEGSHRWHEAKRRLSAFQQPSVARMAHRRDSIHKMTTEISRTYRLVVVEDLNVKGLRRNRKLALSLADAALGEILRQLAYKAVQFVEVDRWFASSKTCSACGYIHQELMLSDRQWRCAGCGTIHQRDWNAAVNILQEGLRLAVCQQT